MYTLSRVVLHIHPWNRYSVLNSISQDRTLKLERWLCPRSNIWSVPKSRLKSKLGFEAIACNLLYFLYTSYTSYSSSAFLVTLSVKVQSGKSRAITGVTGEGIYYGNQTLHNWRGLGRRKPSLTTRLVLYIKELSQDAPTFTTDLEPCKLESIFWPQGGRLCHLPLFWKYLDIGYGREVGKSR